MLPHAMVWVWFETAVHVSMPWRHGPWCSIAVVVIFSTRVSTQCDISPPQRCLVESSLGPGASPSEDNEDGLKE